MLAGEDPMRPPSAQSTPAPPDHSAPTTAANSSDEEEDHDLRLSSIPATTAAGDVLEKQRPESVGTTYSSQPEEVPGPPAGLGRSLTERLASSSLAEGLFDPLFKEEVEKSPLAFKLRRALVTAFIACFINGFIYIFPMISSRMLFLLKGMTRADAVTLGVMSQAGLGLFQYPVARLVQYAAKRGVSADRTDLAQSLFVLVMFVLSLGIMFGVLRNAEADPDFEFSGGTMGLMCVAFLVWGAASGSSFSHASTVINFNMYNASSEGHRRKILALLSMSIACGGLFIVIVYQYGFKSYDLSWTFLFLMLLAFFVSVLRCVFMVRYRPKKEGSPDVDVHPTHTEEEPDLESLEGAPPPVLIRSVSVAPQGVCTLLRSPIVLLTLGSTFFGIGVAGSFMSSIGNLADSLQDPSDGLTFGLSMSFLVAQTVARMTNTVVYAYADFPFLFCAWQTACLTGVLIYVGQPTPMGGYVSSTLVGFSFGGFQSSMPVLAGSAFPGNPIVDYPLSISVTMICASLGAIVVGEVTAVVFQKTSLEDLRANGFFGTLMLFIGIQTTSTILAFDLGRRLRAKKQKQLQELKEAEALKELVRSNSSKNLVPGSFTTLIKV